MSLVDYVKWLFEPVSYIKSGDGLIVNYLIVCDGKLSLVSMENSVGNPSLLGNVSLDVKKLTDHFIPEKTEKKTDPNWSIVGYINQNYKPFLQLIDESHGTISFATIENNNIVLRGFEKSESKKQFVEYGKATIPLSIVKPGEPVKPLSGEPKPKPNSKPKKLLFHSPPQVVFSSYYF